MNKNYSSMNKNHILVTVLHNFVILDKRNITGSCKHKDFVFDFSGSIPDKPSLQPFSTFSHNIVIGCHLG